MVTIKISMYCVHRPTAVSLLILPLGTHIHNILIDQVTMVNVQLQHVRMHLYTCRLVDMALYGKSLHS